MRFLIFTFTIFNFLTMTSQKSVHEFEIKTIDGTTQALSAFKGKKMLFVNTASECGFTSQYEALQNVHSKYEKRIIPNIKNLIFCLNQIWDLCESDKESLTEFLI